MAVPRTEAAGFVAQFGEALHPDGNTNAGWPA